MSEMPDLFTYVFRWIGIIDSRTCPKCRRLIGREYRDQDLFQNVLWDPFEGDIFDLDQGISLAHGGGPHFCLCTVVVEVQVNLENWQPYQEFQETLRQLR